MASVSLMFLTALLSRFAQSLTKKGKDFTFFFGERHFGVEGQAFHQASPAVAVTFAKRAACKNNVDKTITL